MVSLDRDGRSALHYAANEGNILAVRELLEAGSDPGLPDRHGWTPLHFAAQASSADVAAALLDAGVDVDARDEHGITPLFRAVFNSRGRGDVIELLRARGANPFAANTHGRTPVGLARLVANYDVASFFADLPTDTPAPAS